MSKGLIRYRIDWVSMALLLGVLILTFLPIYMSLSPLSLLLITGLLLFFKPIVSLVQHNHVHYAIFNSPALNLIVDLLLAIGAGHTCSEWELHHNIGHHGNRINSPEDTSSVRHALTREYMTKWEYIWTGSLKIYPDCWRMAREFYAKGKKRFLYKMIFETVFWVAVHASFLWFNFWMAFWFLLVANVVNRALVWLGAYWHHLDVPAKTHYDASNMYTGPVFNFISLNIGYHVAHHEQPTLHWSKLKLRSAEILEHIPPAHILPKIP